MLTEELLRKPQLRLDELPPALVDAVWTRFNDMLGILAANVYQNNVKGLFITNTLTAQEYGYNGELDLSNYQFITTTASINDVTVRELQKKDVQFTRGKGFDTFCPVGPWVDTDFRPEQQRIWLEVDGVTKQDGDLGQMIFKVPFLVSFVSRYMTLERGDIIATGTPSGVGPLVPGNVVTVSIDGLGTLRNTVV